MFFNLSNCHTPETCFVVDYEQICNDVGTERDIICTYLTE